MLLLLELVAAPKVLPRNCVSVLVVTPLVVVVPRV